MEVTLDKRYPVDASPAQAWTVLRDIRAVAGCMPGAQITEEISPTRFKGAVKVKVGPAVAAFGGDIEVRELDAAAHRMRLFGKGADKGGSSASMELDATIEAVDGEPERCVLVGAAAVIVNGKFAQFGGRLMGQVSDMVLGQFAENFRAAAAAVPAGAAAPATATTEATAPPPATASPTATAAATASAATIDAAAGAAPPMAGAVVPPTVVPASSAPTVVAAEATAPRTAPEPAARAPNAELNAGRLLWALVKSWFAGLFGKRA